jgi:hypothetical protein
MPSSHKPFSLHGVDAPVGHSLHDGPKYPGAHSSHAAPPKPGSQPQVPVGEQVPLPLQVAKASQNTHSSGLPFSK